MTLLGFRLLDPGPFATVQDRGRPGWRGVGVAPAGAFDRRSHDLANALVGNPPEAATLEICWWAGPFEALAPLALAWAGTGHPVEHLGEAGTRRWPPGPRAVSLAIGDRLRFLPAATGLRAYLAVAGGWQTPEILGSRSVEHRCRPGDVLPILASCPTRPARRIDDATPDPCDGPLRVLPGPDADVDLISGGWLVQAASDRRGVRLRPIGDVSRPILPDRRSAPTAPGAVQWTGQELIILGVAGGTMGGYPHVAHLIAPDLDRLAQARPGDRLAFTPIDLGSARRLDREHRQASRARCQQVRLAVSDAIGHGVARMR